MGTKRPLPPPDQLIMGIHAVREVLLHVPERLLCLFTTAPDEKGERKQELFSLCKKRQIPIEFLSKQELTRLAGTDSHQSILAHVKGRRFYDAKEFAAQAKEPSLVLLLDQIFDPQNFGALLRSAECFGVDGVMWSKNRGSDLTPIAAKASCGASEWLPLIRVSNLAESVSIFQEEGFEAVATLADPKAESLFDFSFMPKTLLIIGSEGEGIQPLIRKRADRSLYLPLQGKIESLNVAQATSAILAFYRFKASL